MSNEFEMLPQYSTVTFTDVWDDVEGFMSDFSESPFTMDELSDDNLSVIFYLLYARYGNNPIANWDVNQWKYKVFSVIYQYGPTWVKRLDIQSKLRGLTDAQLLEGSKAIYNHAFNPSTEPSTDSMDPLPFVNDQNTTNYKKSKMDAYTQLWDILATDVTEEFIVKFKKCFKVFVSPETPLLFVTETDEED